MRLSTKSTYGLRAMVNLALSYNKGALPISEIAAREDISVSYLEQLLNKLRRHGVIKSQRGPRGGYALSRGPAMITVGDIVRVLEGDTAPVYCVANKKGSIRFCDRSKRCVAKGVWEKLGKAIDGVLDSVTLADLVHEVKPEEIHEKDLSR